MAPKVKNVTTDDEGEKGCVTYVVSVCRVMDAEERRGRPKKTASRNADGDIPIATRRAHSASTIRRRSRSRSQSKSPHRHDSRFSFIRPLLTATSDIGGKLVHNIKTIVSRSCSPVCPEIECPKPVHRAYRRLRRVSRRTSRRLQRVGVVASRQLGQLAVDLGLQSIMNIIDNWWRRILFATICMIIITISATGNMGDFIQSLDPRQVINWSRQPSDCWHRVLYYIQHPVRLIVRFCVLCPD